MSATVGQGGALSPDAIDHLKGEFLRLHKMMMEGQDAARKLAAVASMLNAEGIAFPETDPPVVLAKRT